MAFIRDDEQEGAGAEVTCAAACGRSQGEIRCCCIRQSPCRHTVCAECGHRQLAALPREGELCCTECGEGVVSTAFERGLGSREEAGDTIHSRPRIIDPRKDPCQHFKRLFSWPERPFSSCRPSLSPPSHSLLVPGACETSGCVPPRPRELSVCARMPERRCGGDQEPLFRFGGFSASNKNLICFNSLI